MIWIDVADLVVIAGRTLGIATDTALRGLDIAAAETALSHAQAQARPGGGEDRATPAAELLHALLHHRPFPCRNEQIAVAAMLQFLAVNGCQADLDPPEAARDVIAGLANGRRTASDLAAWLAPRLSPQPRRRSKEAPMRAWLPGRKPPARQGVMFERYTARARQVVVAAQEEARPLGHNYIGTEHVLLGLLREGEGVAARALGSLGATLEAARQQVEGIIGRGQQQTSGHIPFTPRAKKVLQLALREALRLDHLYVGTEHILLGLLREGEGVAIEVLANLGIGDKQIRGAVLGLLAEHGPGRGGVVVPPGVRDYDERIAAVARQKDEALDAKNFERAAGLRDTEKQLLAERSRRIEEWSAGVDVLALGEELDRLQREVTRLQDLLLLHGIKPGDGNQRTA